ncbi:hypothetical protein H6P81_007524 [Aristolochia fimbriata]|uniref:Uncharacterized protein n=1 Tax=Aristolochia fimbriata TaxID=158543 RepID=A0AAV7F0I9_ARIFI|nr:hypothetical protein H6P81_007524 [Aristolochia fimbriata]
MGNFNNEFKDIRPSWSETVRLHWGDRKFELLSLSLSPLCGSLIWLLAVLASPNSVDFAKIYSRSLV